MNRLYKSRIAKWYFYRFFGIPKDVEIFKVSENAVHYWKDKEKGIASARVFQGWVLNPFGQDGSTNTAATNNKDAPIRSDSPGLNEGTRSDMNCGYIQVGNIKRVLIDFTLPIVTGTISSITLNLYGVINAGSPDIEVHQLTQSGWTEVGVTYNKYDGTNNWSSAGGDFSATIVDHQAPTNGGYTVWSMTAGINPIAGLTWGSDLNLLLKGASESGVSAYAVFNSKEAASNKPYVEITYSLVLPTVTTQAVSSIGATTVTGNGNITATGTTTPDKRGIVYSTTSHGDPGNVAPGSSGYSGLSDESGSFTTGAFTESLTGLISRTTYYARAYAHNSIGYAYGSEVSFTTIGFTNPGNVYTSNDVYATLAATSGDLKCEVSKDAGANWSAPLTKTFAGADSLLTYGAGSTELWGMAFTRADMVDANFRVRLSQGNISQVYKTFGFATGTETLTGLEIAVEANYNNPTLSIDLLKVKIYYGTSVLPVQAGSQAYASNGRKVGEGAGAGTGTMVYFDGVAWRRVADDTTVLA